MARTLSTTEFKQGPRRTAARGLTVATLITFVLHVLALAWLASLMQAPSVLKEVAEPFYTRSIAPQAPEPQPVAAPRAPPPQKPSVRIATAKPAQARTPKPPQGPASVPIAQEPPEETITEPPLAQASAAEPASTVAQAPDKPASEAEPGAQVSDASTPLPAPMAAASASASDTPPAFLAGWPANTRLRYDLGGNFRGELHGNAQVLWQRDGTRYQAVIQLDVGFLLSSRFTSQGEITESGLRPEVYEEQVRSKRRGVRIGEDVRLDNGDRVPRPQDVQDAASQFLELGHRFATGQLKLQPGSQLNFWLARPGGVDEWTYDVIGEDTVHLPRLGPVQAVHLKPRPLAKPRGPIMAEIWFAPSLQYLPVRIRLTSGPDTYVDLVVETVEQK
ncbi:DUF3108 domain-containing protein [Ottowia thiooxydans]|uniref:DUF3108 domain-containing protein n=1 Tax=Ottowia thiooxydans TaxID=219182 RepID=UPI000424CE04|nr:DUF3108 domain-containing protein [Ottowia thiooxydans]